MSADPVKIKDVDGTLQELLVQFLLDPKLREAILQFVQMYEEGQRHRMFGVIGVELSLQNGIAHKVRRYFNDTIK